MAYNARKTEHTGPKRGRGGYAGRKANAKRESAKMRRRGDAKEITRQIDEILQQGRRIS